MNYREDFREKAVGINKLARQAGEAWERLQSKVEAAKIAVEKRLIDTGGNGGSSGIATLQEQKQELISRIEDLSRQVLLQHAEMKARRTRAKEFATARGFEHKILGSLHEYMPLSSGSVTREEVGVGDAATRVLNVVNTLIKSIEEKY